MKNYFFKPELENLSQGARLKFVRELRYMSKPNVAEFLELGGEKPTDSIDKYERNAREPQLERLEDTMKQYEQRGYQFSTINELKQANKNATVNGIMAKLNKLNGMKSNPYSY